MARSYPSRRSGRAVYRTPSRVWLRRRTKPPHYGRRGGTAVLSGTLTLTATGTKQASGTATITATLTLTASGTKQAAGTATLTGTLSLTASGTKQTGIGLPPRPRVRWQFVLGPASGGHSLSLTEATARRYTARLTEPSELAFSIDGRHPQAAAIDELATDVHVLWSDDNGATRILDRCRVGATQDDVTEAEHTVQVTCLDYKAVLARRRLYSGAPLTHTGVDQAEIAWALVNYTQGLPGGNLGISKSWTGTAPTGQAFDRTFELGDSVGERVQEVSERIGGFDWDISPLSPSALEFGVWYPERGVARNVVLEYGGLMARATRNAQPSEYANALRYTGGGDPPPTPQERAAADIATVPQGRWDAVFGDDGLTTQPMLDDRADWQLGQSETAQPVWTVQLRRGGWAGPDHIWLGDPVRLVVMSGRLASDITLRVYEIEIAIDDGIGETVTLTLGGRRPSYRRRATAAERRLTNLERR